jgi:hypothetical protein
MRPGGEMDDHASLLTRCSGFESWPGHRSCVREVPSSSGEDVPLTWGKAVVRVHPGPLVCLTVSSGKGYPIGDGARLERG